MQRILFAFVIMLAIAPTWGQNSAGPSSMPATRSAGNAAQEQRRLQSEIAARRKALSDAFDSTDEGSKLLASAQAADSRLQNARKEGTPQERLDASSNANKQRMAYASAASAFVESDRQLIELIAAERQASIDVRQIQNAPPASRWRLKAGAPPVAKVWLDSQPELHRLRQEAQAARAARESDAMTAPVKDRIARMQRQLDETKRRPVPTVAFKDALGGSHQEPRADAVEARSSQIRQLTNAIADAKRELAAGRAPVVLPRTDSSELIVPELSLEVGAFGHLSGVFDVVQVLGPKQVLIEVTRRTLWVEGIDTTRMTDDIAIKIDGDFVIPATKQYETVLGARRTVLLVQPADYREWIELVD